VTRDHDLLVLQQSQDIMMITPEAFMAILREQGPVESLATVRDRAICLRCMIELFFFSPLNTPP
jgi:hypothetical protein